MRRRQPHSAFPSANRHRAVQPGRPRGRYGRGGPAGQTITAVYTGWLYSDTAADHKGNIFEGPNAVAQFSLNGVIAGWRQGIPGMRVNGLRRLVIPPELAYGNTTPSPSEIPTNATLLFEVQIISIP